MGFLDDASRTIKADVKYENIYTVLNKNTGLRIQDIFYLCVLVGFKEHKKSEEFQLGRKEFRVSYLEEIPRSILYAIANEVKPLTELSTEATPESYNQIVKEFQLYSNGGMELLLSRVFKEKYHNGTLQENYDDYDIDILKYLYDQINEIPF